MKPDHRVRLLSGFTPHFHPHFTQMVTLQVKVVTGARANRVVGSYGDGIKIQVSAPPEDGKANKAVLQVLAGALKLKPSQIQIISGQSLPRKVIAIWGIDEQMLQTWIASLIS